MFKIAIVGGGPAGLTLGVLLHKRKIPFTLFELRAQPSEEEYMQPSGSLDLHDGSGLDAIRACGLLEECMSLTGDCTEAQKIVDRHGQVLLDDQDEDGTRPEISRNKLNRLLHSHLPASSIRWNHKLSAVRAQRESTGPGVELDFGQNGIHHFDLVVGADGAWSKVRKFLTTVEPVYAGIQNVTLNIRQLRERHPDIAKLVGTGTFSAMGNRHGIFSQRSTRASTRIYIFITTADEHYAHSAGLDKDTPAQARDHFVGEGSLFGHWASCLKDLITVACDDETAENAHSMLDIRPLYKLPAGHVWDHQPSATLVGDASHLMNPPAGEGVNQAMRDSLLLSQAICTAHECAQQNSSSVQAELAPLLRGFEVNMAKEAKKMVDDTVEVNKIMFGNDDGSRALAGFFNSFLPNKQ